MLRKIIDCESLEISQENASDGVYFSKVTYSQYTDYNSAIKRLLHIFSLEYITKTSCLLRENSMMDQRFIKFRSCSIQLAILSKNRAHVRLFCRSAESFDIFEGKPPWWRLLFSKGASLEFMHVILYKKDSTTEVFEILKNIS